MLQWVVEYELRGLLRLYLFRAENEAEARVYVNHLCKQELEMLVTRLEQLPMGATTANLYRLSPRTDNSIEAEQFPRGAVMTCLSVASRKTPQAAGEQKHSNKLLLICPKKGSFLEPLGNDCINWLLMLY
jgi:hypothetical protein